MQWRFWDQRSGGLMEGTGFCRGERRRRDERAAEWAAEGTEGGVQAAVTREAMVDR